MSLLCGVSLVAQLVNNLPTMQETQVRFLGREDPLEKGMATRSSILSWRIPGTEEPGGPQPVRWHRVGHSWGLALSFSRARARRPPAAQSAVAAPAAGLC